MNTPILAVTAAILSAVALTSNAQGPLSPPGPPAPTMKSLDEIGAKVDQAEAKTEKRIPITSLPFTITAPGSYYLTGNLTGVAGQNGIIVDADDVTIDLNGFQLSGPGNSGIVGNSRLAVRNGSISGWSQSGITAGGAGAIIENIRASNNAGRGIVVATHALVRSCTVTNCGTIPTGRGIATGSGSVVSHCAVSGTSGADAIAISLGNDSVVSESTARDNNSAGGAGIAVGFGSSVIRCVANLNTGAASGIVAAANSKIVDCVASNNDGTNTDGITATDRVLITGCSATSNGGDGFRVTSRCTVLNNHAAENADDGFEVVTTSNRIEGNNAILNLAVGFRVNNGANSADNLIIRNSAANNAGEEYDIAANNAAGPIVTQANVASNQNPHANFDFD